MTIEIGHRATVRQQRTNEGFTHDWEVFVQGANGARIDAFVEKIVFTLHKSFTKPKRGKERCQQVMSYMDTYMPIISFHFVKEWELNILCFDLSVVKIPPFRVTEKGYGSFTLPIEIYFKTNHPEDTRKAR